MRILPLLLLGCGTPAMPSPEAQAPDERSYLSGPELLVRASLALRGHRPSPSELDQIAADPSSFETLVDGYLASPAFEETVREMHDEWLLADTDNNYYPMGFPKLAPLRQYDAWAINESVSESPARLAAYIVTEDRPYTELLTADYLLANDIVAAVWGLPYDAANGGWQVTRYTDGRPPAGVLSDPWLHVRHASTPTNKQRARAAHLARAFLCHDYMKREVRVPEDTDLTAGGRNAIQNNPVCVSCHQTLDPLGAAFAPYSGVIIPEATWSYPIASHEPEAPAHHVPARFYGEPSGDLYELGQLIADDSRFWRCAIRRFAGQLLAMAPSAVPDPLVDRHVAWFRDANFAVRPLIRRLVLSSTFAEAAGDPQSGLPVDGLRRATPWRLARSMEELSGVRWTTQIDFGLGFGRIGEVPLMEDVTFGFKTLAGGPDGYDTWEPSQTANPSTLLTLRALASLTAPAMAERELALPTDQRRALRGVVDPRVASPEALAEAHFLLFGQRPALDGPEVAALGLVFASANGADDPIAGWTAVLYAVLQHPRMLFY